MTFSRRDPPMTDALRDALLPGREREHQEHLMKELKPGLRLADMAAVAFRKSTANFTGRTAKGRARRS